jgi:hypothetical protein
MKVLRFNTVEEEMIDLIMVSVREMACRAVMKILMARGG